MCVVYCLLCFVCDCLLLIVGCWLLVSCQFVSFCCLGCVVWCFLLCILRCCCLIANSCLFVG